MRVFSFLFVLTSFSCLIPSSAISAPDPACVDEQQAMRVRIDIPVANRTRLVACQSAEGTQVFVSRLDKDLKATNESMLASPPWEDVEIFRPAGRRDPLLLLRWYLKLNFGGTEERISFFEKSVTCANGECKVGAAVCRLDAKAKEAVKKLLKKSATNKGAEQEELSEERAALAAQAKAARCP